MNDEGDIKLLLRVRQGLERKIRGLQVELDDLRKAVSEVDKIIVKRGFKRPLPEHKDEPAPSTDEVASIRSKDGTVLGSITVDDRDILFVPEENFAFTISTPPFKSFLVDRVLEGMRSSDEGRASSGEISVDEVISYEISADEERLRSLVIHNYGGERRLREIRSSIRWTFDKMHEKLV